MRVLRHFQKDFLALFREECPQSGLSIALVPPQLLFYPQYGRLNFGSHFTRNSRHGRKTAFHFVWYFMASRSRFECFGGVIYPIKKLGAPWNFGMGASIEALKVLNFM
jgi:hypothetical protein